jgi:hypothetical protein
VGQEASRDVGWLLGLHVVLQHLLPVPQLCQVLLDPHVFLLQFILRFRESFFDNLLCLSCNVQKFLDTLINTSSNFFLVSAIVIVLTVKKQSKP